jgi:hypothetical protein
MVLGESRMETRHSKAELVGEIAGAWTDLNTALEGLTPAQMTEIRDAQGWTVKDHLLHMAAWARGVVGFLQGQPLHAGLGVEEQLLLAGDEDATNAVLQEQGKDMSLADALTELRGVHNQLLKVIEPLSDDDLYRANSDFQPAASGERDERPVIGLIYGNSAHHWREHLKWIESLVSRGG